MYNCRPGGRLEPRRRQRLSLQRLAISLHAALQRSPADRHTSFGQQALAYHSGVAAMPNEPLAQPTLKTSSRFGRSGDLNGFTPPAAM
jgi:hypothetical protein